MQTTVFSEREGNQELRITCNINVVIAFEDAAAGKHAEAFYEHLKERLGAEFEFTRYQWSFALLQDPDVRDAAAHDAAVAEVFGTLSVRVAITRTRSVVRPSSRAAISAMLL